MCNWNNVNSRFNRIYFQMFHYIHLFNRARNAFECVWLSISWNNQTLDSALITVNSIYFYPLLNICARSYKCTHEKRNVIQCEIPSITFRERLEQF